MSDRAFVSLAGKPRGWGRPQARIVKPRGVRIIVPKGARAPFVHFYLDEQTRKYEAALRENARCEMASRVAIGGPVRAKIIASYKPPKSATIKQKSDMLAGIVMPISRGTPDLDNIMKMCDALNEVVFEDDVQICEAYLLKRYAEYDAIEIEITPYAPNEGSLLALFE